MIPTSTSRSGTKGGAIKTVHLSYFASLRESRGVPQESVGTKAATAGDLYAELQGRHSFCLSKNSVRVSINDAFVPWQAELKAGDRIAFIPPVSGG